MYLRRKEVLHGVLRLIHQVVELIDDGVESRNEAVYRAGKVFQVIH